MPIELEKWLIQKYKDRIHHLYGSQGNLLVGTMMTGDEEAGEYVYPKIGRVTAYKLSGNIQPVPTNFAALDNVKVRPDDFEASHWIRRQDMYKMGPNQQEAVAKELARSGGVKADQIKMDALKTFKTVAGSSLKTIGDGTTEIDVVDVYEGLAGIRAAGGPDSMMFCPLPEGWFAQLEMYEEWKKANYNGPADLPFATRANIEKKTRRGCQFFTMPDEVFETIDEGSGNFSMVSYMWHHEAMGADMPIKDMDPSFTQHTELEGSPWLGKIMLSGCCVGIEAQGVVQLKFKKQIRPTRYIETVYTTPAP